MSNIEIGSLVKINWENSKYNGYYGVVSTSTLTPKVTVILFNKDNSMVQFYKDRVGAHFLTEEMFPVFLSLLTKEELTKLNLSLEFIEQEHFNFYMVDSILKNNVSLLKQILEAGGDPNGSAYSGDTFLKLSVNLINFEVFKLLIDSGADIDNSGIVTYILFKLKDTLDKKSEYENEKFNRMFELLLDIFYYKGKKLHIEKSTLFMARYESRLEEFLLEKLNLLTNTFSMPSKDYIAEALKFRKANVIKKMIKQGIDVNANLAENITAFSYAIENFKTKFRLQESFEILHLLVESGANVNEKDDKGTPLWFYLVERKMLGYTRKNFGSNDGDEGYEGFKRTIEFL